VGCGADDRARGKILEKEPYSEEMNRREAHDMPIPETNDIHELFEAAHLLH